MYLCKLRAEGFKNFGDPFEVEFRKGLNVLVGENGVGKSAVVDAIRVILQEDEFGRKGFDDSDFHCLFAHKAQRVKSINIGLHFSDLSREEQVAFLPWTDLAGNATLSLRVDGPPTTKGRYKRVLWGGSSINSIFEWELMDTINCIYLPPLRDAEAKLKEGRGSRLARLLKNMNRAKLKDGKPHSIVEKVCKLNQELATEKGHSIAEASKQISKQLVDAVGDVFGQAAKIQFAEASFDRIVESLRLLFFPEVCDSTSLDEFRSLQENSLGYNNLLYLATVLAELASEDGNGGEPEYLKVLLIEEPEAHLHPQLQTRLLQFLERKAKEARIQVIVTTHSPVLASAVSLDSIIHLSGNCNCRSTAIRIDACGLSPESSSFVSRWLDVTKSTLLFAKGVILVEGIAETLLLPELAKSVLRDYNAKNIGAELPASLADAGISVINMNGIYFKHFMQLFCNLGDGIAITLPVRCSGLTDNDPPTDTKPTPANTEKGENPALELITLANKSARGRIYASPLKTFEYDLAMESANLTVMLPILAKLWPTRDGTVYSELDKLGTNDWANETDENAKAEAAFTLLRRIDDAQIGKGFYAQALAEELASNKDTKFAVPDYIRKAVLWAMGKSDAEIG